MWRRCTAVRQQSRSFHAVLRRCQEAQSPLIDIKNATFYRRYPSTTEVPGSNPPLFAGLNFSLVDGHHAKPEHWSVLSPSSIARTTFLQVLAGQHICMPPTARSYPYLSHAFESPQQAIKYVGFDADRGSNVGGTSVRGAYMSARYESRREETDFSVYDYLTGHTELNALERTMSDVQKQTLDDAVDKLNLQKLLFMPVANLSNGQTRRARIAKALMARPEVLLLDGPFMGLDPNTLAKMSKVLMHLAERRQPRLVLSLRPEDGVPDWISHLVIADSNLQVLAQGPKEEILNSGRSETGGPEMVRIVATAKIGHQVVTTSKLSRDGFHHSSPALNPGESVVDMKGVKIAYGSSVVLGDWTQDVDGEEKAGLWWSLRRGQRCGIFGPNGSGKTTMLSLITSDHPQTYSIPIKLFGRSRLPSPGQPGISVFDLQSRMGHSSPEVHAFFPKGLTLRRSLQSAWADAPMSKPRVTDEAKRKVNACLRWFQNELRPGRQQQTTLENIQQMLDAGRHARAIREEYAKATEGDKDLEWADDLRFGELSFSSQRLLLFLKAIISSPDLVILDEALSGIDESTRDKALMFLSHGENIASVSESGANKGAVAGLDMVEFEGLSPRQALLVISHAKEDVPGCLREWICLPEPGEGRTPRTGTLPGPLELNTQCWDQIWGR